MKTHPAGGYKIFWQVTSAHAVKKRSKEGLDNALAAGSWGERTVD